jgi:hypothetical protein
MCVFGAEPNELFEVIEPNQISEKFPNIKKYRWTENPMPHDI